MKTITIEQFLKLDPCYPEDRIREIAGDKAEWTALDILALEDVPAEDRLWAALWEELIDAPILHEFAYRCADRALARVKEPDPRSVAAIETKRRWLRGEATDEELDAAIEAAGAAARAAWAAGAAARDAAWAAALAAARAARAAGAAARDAALAAARAARAAGVAARYAALAAEREAQVLMLRELLEVTSHDQA